MGGTNTPAPVSLHPPFLCDHFPSRISVCLCWPAQCTEVGREEGAGGVRGSNGKGRGERSCFLLQVGVSGDSCGASFVYGVSLHPTEIETVFEGDHRDGGGRRGGQCRAHLSGRGGSTRSLNTTGKHRRLFACYIHFRHGYFISLDILGGGGGSVVGTCQWTWPRPPIILEYRCDCSMSATLSRK